MDIIAREIYRADGVTYTSAAEKAIKEIEALGYGKIPVCVAKTQYSLSDDPAKLGMTMPGLPKVPAANSIDVDDKGNISGLF